MAFSGLQYNAGSTGSPSGVDKSAAQAQLHAFFWLKKAIITARKQNFFSQLASTVGMPKNWGKACTVYEYVPLLDARNVNDQGIDANGVTMDPTTIKVTFPAAVLQVANASKAAAAAAIAASGLGCVAGADDSGAKGAGFATLTISQGTSPYAADALGRFSGLFTAAQFAAIVGVDLVENLMASGNDVILSTAPNQVGMLALLNNPGPAGTKLALLYNTAAGTPATDDITYFVQSGNMYGSSRDIGTITGKIPSLTEGGGRVNRVGFTRLQRTGNLNKFGFFFEFTKESLDFDTDEELLSHLSTELMNGAVQLTEAVLQKDLLAAAATVLYASSSDGTVSATSHSGITGETSSTKATVVQYADFIRLSQTLTDLRTPKQTKVVTGSRMIDTKTIPAGRVMFCGNELIPIIKGMKDLFGERAFIPVQMYADAGTVLEGEIGTIDEFRIVIVPEMLHWSDGAAVVNNAGYRETNGRYNVYPMLVVGDDSFTTIGFQTDGKMLKFNVITKMPGNENAHYYDPYGERGFSSIKWYYGSLIKRSERLGLILTAAPM